MPGARCANRAPVDGTSNSSCPTAGLTPTVMAALCAVMVGTSFLSGVFGMAGGLILVGVLLALLPLPPAMALHAVTQIASNLWRALFWWRHVRWAAAWPYVAGSLVSLGAWSLTRYVP